jgi:hypothetical protein
MYIILGIMIFLLICLFVWAGLIEHHQRMAFHYTSLWLLFYNDSDRTKAQNHNNFAKKLLFMKRKNI